MAHWISAGMESDFSGDVEVIGHDMIAPGRKTDPGPTMDRRVYDILNSGREDDHDSWSWYVGKVQDYLNGRSGPGTEYDVVEQLPHGTELEVIERRGAWWKVETMLGKGFDIQIYDKNVSIAKLIGANKDYIENEIPHISSLMYHSCEKLLEKADVIIVGNKSEEFKKCLKNVTKKQIVVDLVRILEKSESIGGDYYGICW